jgi:hypothetical protein
VTLARVAVVAAAASLASPVAAHAALVTVDQGCYASRATIRVSGAGFAANAPILITGAAQPKTVTADDKGTFEAVPVIAPRVLSATPHTITLTVDGRGDTPAVATVRIPIARALFWSNAPVSGPATERVAWRFAGFVPGRPIYGHLRYHGRTVATHRFGVATGPCGVLTAVARRVPTQPVPAGRWQIKLDQQRAFAGDAPGRVIDFLISRG